MFSFDLPYENNIKSLDFLYFQEGPKENVRKKWINFVIIK